MRRPNSPFRLAAICVLALGCAGAQGNGGFQYYGITHVSWSYNEYTFDTATASRNDLAATDSIARRQETEMAVPGPHGP